MVNVSWGYLWNEQGASLTHQESDGGLRTHFTIRPQGCVANPPISFPPVFVFVKMRGVRGEYSERQREICPQTYIRIFSFISHKKPGSRVIFCGDCQLISTRPIGENIEK